MSNIPPNPYNNAPGQHQNANPVPQHQYGQVPPSHPPGIKQDSNSNSPVPLQGYNATLANHFNQSASSSPAFNQPGVPPQPTSLRPSPIHPPMKPTVASPSQIPMQNIPQSSANSGTPSVTLSSSPYPPSYQQQQINDNAPPLVPSSQYNLVNGPPGPMTGTGVSVANQYPVPSNSFNPTSLASKPPIAGPGIMNPPFNQRPPLPQTSMPAGPMTSQPNFSPNGPPGLPINSPLIPPTSSSLGPGPNLGPPTSGPPFGPQRILNGPGSNMQGPMRPPMPGQALGHSVPGQGMVQPLPGQGMGPPVSGQGMLPPVSGQGMLPPVSVQGMFPPVSGQGMGPPVSGQGMGPPVSGQGMGPPVSRQGLGPPVSGQGMAPPVSSQGLGPQISGQAIGLPVSAQAMGPTITGQGMGQPMSGPGMRPPVSAPGMGPPVSAPGMGPPMSAPGMGPSVSAPGMGPPVLAPGMGPPGTVPGMAPPVSAPGMGPPVSAPGMGPPVSAPGMGPPVSAPGMAKGPVRGPASGPPTSQGYVNQSNGPPTSAPQMGPGFSYNSMAPAQGGIPNQPMMQQVPPQQPPMGQQMPPAPQMGPKSNMQNRYPQTQQPSYSNHQPPPGFGKQYPQYSTQQLNQQMGQLSVTKQGFDQLWGHHMIDLLQCKHILPEYPEEPQEIKLANFPDAVNCSPDIFRCTVNRIPDTSSLLQKSRLPLGLLIHPFKDLNHLPVIQCSSIVRCRACRTYINPFVYFVDAKRWKCNLCYRVNELPEEFQYDPVSQSYGDPTRRPEIKSATIEFIAPAEYMLRPPQPAVYLFLFDVSQIARDSGYLQVVCDTLKNSLEQLPGDARTQLGFICYDAHVHYYLMSDGLTRPKEMTVLDIDEIFLPSPESLLVNLGEYKEMIKELLTVLPQRYSTPGVPVSALGAALQAAYKLIAPTGGRITVFQTCLPNIGPGALQSREDPNARSSKEVAHLNPATDFFKRLALDCSGAQVSVDLFLLSSQYCDLATLSGMSKFSAGTVYHIPLFRAARSWQAEQLTRMFTRYLTRKIGFEAVMRVRCTRGITIHTFHGNLFVRSTDLLSLPNVSPDAGFGLQLTIDESLSDLQQVCFQAALLYTSSKGERRIRVHTLALPIASNLTDVLHSADTACIVGLLSKMAVDRSASASMSEAREALMNVAVDALSAHRLAQNLPVGAVSSALHAPTSLKLLPLYLLALLKRKAFRTGTSTRLDERVADMCAMKCLPLPQLMRLVYPDLYPIHNLQEMTHAVKQGDEEEIVPDPPRLHLTAERININGAYLLDDGETMIIYICHGVSPAFLSECWGVAAYSQVADEARSLPRVDSVGNALLHAFVDKLNDDRPYASNLLVLKDNSPSRQVFVERLVDDRVESAFSYYEFLQHVKTQVK